jgi:hypothetical protein
VLIVVTHCFDRALMETVTRDNVNPIEKVERTQLIIASVVHQQEDVTPLIRDNQLARVKEFNGKLFEILRMRSRLARLVHFYFFVSLRKTLPLSFSLSCSPFFFFFFRL